MHQLEKWCQAVGYLQFMVCALSGFQGLFSQMQEDLNYFSGGSVPLSTGFHQNLSDFQWLLDELSS